MFSIRQASEHVFNSKGFEKAFERLRKASKGFEGSLHIFNSKGVDKAGLKAGLKGVENKAHTIQSSFLILDFVAAGCFCLISNDFFVLLMLSLLVHCCC